MSSSLIVVCFSNMSSWISRFFIRSLNSSFTWFNFSKLDTQESGSTPEPVWSFSVCCLRHRKTLQLLSIQWKLSQKLGCRIYYTYS
jgi:hypothetical protein